MEISLERAEGRIVILGVEGEVDKNSSPELREALLSILAEKPGALAVDLSGATYMDSSGIATLTEGLQLSHRDEIPFRLFGLTQAVKVVFELARLERMFEIFDSREAALEGLP